MAQKVGFTWNKHSKCYLTKEAALAKNFRPYADKEADGAIARFERRLRFSEATDSSLDIPCPAGLSYLGFQRAGIAYALQRPVTLIGDGMRLGKTVQSVGVINADTGIRNVLIEVKASLKINWEREVRRWLARPMTVGIWEPSERMPRTDIVITNYDNARRQYDAIRKRRWDLKIFDECHRLSNPDAQRTKYLLGYDYTKKGYIAPIQSDRTLFLSGTPIVKRPVNLWPICHAADPEGLGKDWYQYTKRYCGAWDAPWGYDTSGASNLQELQERLRGSFMIRRTREMVLNDLPENRRQVIPIPADKAKDLLREEREFYGTYSGEMGSIRRDAESLQPGDISGFNKVVTRLSKLSNVGLEKFSALRHKTAVAKIPFVLDLLEDILCEEQKVVIFAHHQDVIQGLMVGLKKYHPVCHYGEVSDIGKQQSVDRFAQDERCRVFIGSLTGAEGYSLALSSYALFAEFDWTPTVMQQAEDRLWLMDKVDSILYQYLVFDGSLDANMAQDYVECAETLRRALG